MKGDIERRHRELIIADELAHPGAHHGHRYLFDRIRDHVPNLGRDVLDDRAYQPDVDGYADDGARAMIIHCDSVASMGCDEQEW